jgi:glycolate oxidase FAD binding subunit
MLAVARATAALCALIGRILARRSGTPDAFTASEPRRAMTTLTDFAERVRAACAPGRPLRLRGGGTKDFYGGPLEGEVFDTRAYAGIVAYEPTELVVTARCGTPLAELQAALAADGQMLAFEPPAFGPAATVGGVVAAGLSGPRRASAGALRDFVLGAVLVDASGQVLRFGGQVMKNVAGYDVSRLLAGSLGILGPIAEVSLKVLPLPAAQATVAMSRPEAEALRLLAEWGGQPLPVSASAWHDGRLTLRFSGARAAVDAALARFRAGYGAADVDAARADAFWEGLREQADPFFAGDEPLWRLSLPPTAAPLALPGRQLLEWGGALRWLKSAAAADTIRAAAQAAGGTATLFRAADKSAGAFAPPATAVLEVHRRLKREFDPRGLFNPGRMFAGI